MKTVSFKINNLSVQFLSELRAILARAFGNGASLSEEGVVSIDVPDEWSEDAVISMVKSLFAYFELDYARKTSYKP
jgi:hypothetical protein